MNGKLTLNALFAAACIALLGACGGGGGGSSDPAPAAPAAPAPVAVSVSPSSAEVDIGDTAQFTASVSNASNTAVTWQVNDVTGGNETVGTISDTGLYTPPSELPATTNVTIRAIAAADTTRSATASVQLFPRFSNRTLSGRYAFQVSGTDGEFAYTAIGSFVADGAGGLEGVQDINVDGDFSSNIPFSGTYSINERGEGTATLTSLSGATDIGFVMQSRDLAFFIPVDGVELSVGGFEKQDASAFSNAVLDGAFVFASFGFEPGYGPVNAIGRIIGNGAGAIIDGDQDVNEAGFFIPRAPITSGSYSVSTATGRGTASITSASLTTAFIVYVVDAERIIFMSRDADLLSHGFLERQAAGGFSNASLNGDYVFASNGTGAFGPIVTVGRLTADGSGNLAAGVLDENYAGFIGDGVDFDGSYAISSDGRGTATTTSAGGDFSVVSRMVNGDRFVFLHTENDRVVTGSAIAQQGGLSAATLDGSYALLGGGRTPNERFEVIGTLSGDGAGIVAVDLTVAVAEFAPFMVGIWPLAGAGSYQLAANGRGVGAIPGFSENMRFYMASPERLVLINHETQEVASFGGRKRY
ncbi:MAG: hypothetical protein ACNA7W_14225 [Pseudomonadales bacterium]